MNASAYLLLCLSEGDAEGEGTEVRGVGTGHVRTGSSRMLSFSISSIIYSTDTWKQRGIKKMDDEADEMKAMWIKGNVKICQEDGNNEQKGHRVEEEFGEWSRRESEREKSHFRILPDQYNSTAISIINSLSCIQFALFPAPQIHFTASANKAICSSWR